MKSRTFFYSILILAMMTWGISWASGKYLSSLAFSEVLVFFRFLITFLSLIPAVWYFDKNWKVTKEGSGLIILGGLFMTSYNFLFFNGLKTGLAGAGGVLVTTLNPVITFIIASFFSFKRPSCKEAAGLSLGITGGLVMIHVWRFSFSDLIQSGNLYFLAASFTWAFMTLTSQKSSGRISLLKFTMYVHGTAALMAFSFSFFMPYISIQIFKDAFSLPYPFWLNIFYLAVISTSFGTTIYFEASRAIGSKSASSFIFIVPLTALIGGIFFLKEKADIVIISGGSLSLLAVYLLNSVKKNPKPAES